MEKKIISLDEQKQIELQIMDSVVDYCEKNNLRYYLAGGTLLGAVRHQGFIPWDDDMDITMPREDYEKLLNGFNIERTDSYKLIWYGNTDYFRGSAAKVTDTRTILREKNTDTLIMAEYGVYIDIFPIDVFPNSIPKIKAVWKRENLLARMDYCKHYTNLDAHKWYGKLFYSFLKVLVSCVSEKKILMRRDELATKYRNIKNPKYYVAIIVMTYGLGEIHDIEWYGYGTKLPFEGRMYSVPQNYNAILTALYGDYMTPPPPEKRTIPHTAEVYWKDDKEN